MRKIVQQSIEREALKPTIDHLGRAAHRATVPVVAVRSNASSRIEFNSTRSEPSWW